MPRQATAQKREVTISDIVHRLGVSLFTVHIWRRGSTKREPLPQNVYPYGRSRRVTFDERVLKTWLKNYRPDLFDKWQTLH